MNAFSCSAACLPLLLFGAVSTHAQQPTTTSDHPTATTTRTAQTAARLRGTVTDIFGNPVGGAFVAIEGTTLRAITGRTGLYLLEGVPAGRHTVEVHSVGYARARVKVEVRDEAQASPIEVAPIRLVERTDSLPTVEVIGRKEQSYKNSVSFVGTKTATALKDVPQSVGYVTKELVLDQGASTVNDAPRATAIRAICSTACGHRPVCGDNPRWPTWSVSRSSRDRRPPSSAMLRRAG